MFSGGPGDARVLASPARQRGRPAADPRDAQISRLQKENQLGQELARVASSWKFSQNCVALLA